VTIGSFTLIGPAVQIYTPMHPLNAALRRREEFGKPVEIGSDVWVGGGGAIIFPDVRIGSRSVGAWLQRTCQRACLPQATPVALFAKIA
jgi:maltose O-acetyltransferase